MSPIQNTDLLGVTRPTVGTFKLTVGDLKTFVATAPQVQTDWNADPATLAGILNRPGLATSTPPTAGLLPGPDKVWIDAQRAAGSFVRLAGDTMTGSLQIASAGAFCGVRPTALAVGGFNVATGDANGGLQLQSDKHLLMYSSHGAQIGSGSTTMPITISPGWTGAFAFKSTEATFTRLLYVSTQETGNAPAIAIRANPSGVSSLQLQSSGGQWYGQIWSNGTNDMRLTGSGTVWVKAGEGGNTNAELLLKGGSTSTNPVIFVRGDGGIAAVNAAGDFVKLSDVRAKRDILAVPYGLTTVLSLRPVTFRYLHLGADARPSIGFIAQEVQEIVPEAVAAISEDKLGLIDSALTPVLVKAIQELTAMVEQLTARVATLEGAP